MLQVYKIVMAKETWTQLKARLIQERGSICERCRIVDATDLHHSLIGRMKRKPELNVEYNAELLCKECHANAGSYIQRDRFWHRQCKRYGADEMRAWFDGLNLIIKERFE